MLMSVQGEYYSSDYQLGLFEEKDKQCKKYGHNCGICSVVSFSFQGCIKSEKNLRNHIAARMSYLKKYIGSRDYKAASPVMRQTLVNVVNEDLSNYAKEIEEPTLLIWGEYDDEAPVEEARVLEGMMVDAALIVLPGTHYAYLENIVQVVKIIKEFLKSIFLLLESIKFKKNL